MENICRLADPHTASLDDLKNEIKRLEVLSAFYDTKQLALKKFINSVYGAIASKYFLASNTAVAESITAQGQDLNHFSENSVNQYYNGIFQSDAELDKVIYVSDEPYSASEQYYKKTKEGYECVGQVTEETYNSLKDDWKNKLYKQTTFIQRLGITREQAKSYNISMGKTTDTGKLDSPDFDYLDPNVMGGVESLTVAGDTDSCAANTIIYVNGKKMTIEDAFTMLKYANDDIVISMHGQEIVPIQTDHKTKAFINDNVVDKQMKYISRHKVKKARYKIKSESGKEVIVTEDHSCMVIRNGVLIPIKAKDIDIKTDKLVTII